MILAMVRYVALAVLSIALLTAPSPRLEHVYAQSPTATHDKEQQRGLAEDKAHQHQGDAAGVTLGETGAARPKHGESCGDPKNKYDNACNEMLTAYSTLALAVLTLALVGVGGWVGCNQIKVMNRQRRLMQSSLELERPWLIPRVEANNVMEALNIAEPTFPIELRAVCVVTNEGRSLAKIIAQWGCLRVLNTYDSSELTDDDIRAELSSEPLGDGEHPSAPLVVAPGAKHSPGTYPESMTEPKAARFLNDRWSIVLLYFVLYEDIFGNKHETRFCWEWSMLMPGFVKQSPGGPPRWTKYT